MEAAMLLEKLKAKTPEAVLGSADRYGSLEIQIERSWIAKVVRILREDPEFAFDMLIDLVSIDYSLYPNHNGDRFAASYILKSLKLGHRLQLKSAAPEEDPSFPTISYLYSNADWLEREAFDQMGLRFTGHKNLKRLLNHHEFVGHPLRKDYPITRRQALSANESLMDEMALRLKEKGYE
jgi:NADH:ubiquinone oxidoreductase subunit C